MTDFPKIFRELLERTAGKAKRLNNRLNTPQPTHYENYRDFGLPRCHHQCKRDVAPPNVMLMNKFEDFEMPSPRYVLSTPGFAKHKGNVQRFRRFGSTIGWVTDEYTKHKQHGPSYYDSP
ncbi:hypothetical protein IscW_ISCW000717 [Ixodes scapularis]|uniref:Uncharacterized protein n=1 Tax=Ixodes scapularis TaxID=6945 RepID=B7P1Q9_IXOSC|nr:hypothetical protein IscW_ISCW000717 [Ixodes scapularis]|eukprot:XP_002433467.1 hypothetical protein IscW_ISCW000717 [Ixodes scapularis]